MHCGDSQLSLVSLVLRHKIILYYQFSAVRLNITVGPMCQQGFGVRICLLTPSLYAVYNADMSEKKRSHSFCTVRLTLVCSITAAFFFIFIKKLGFFRPLNPNLTLWRWYVFLLLKNNRKPFRTTELAVTFALCNLIWCKLHTADYSCLRWQVSDETCPSSWKTINGHQASVHYLFFDNCSSQLYELQLHTHTNTHTLVDRLACEQRENKWEGKAG